MANTKYYVDSIVHNVKDAYANNGHRGYSFVMDEYPLTSDDLDAILMSLQEHPDIESAECEVDECTIINVVLKENHA